MITGVKTITGLLWQGFTNEPTVTVLANDSGASITHITRDDAGEYTALLSSSILTEDRCFFTITPQPSPDANTFQIGRVDGNEFKIRTFDSSGTPSDDILNETSFEIKIYPETFIEVKSGTILYKNDSPNTIIDFNSLESAFATTLTATHYSTGVFDIVASDSVFVPDIGLTISDNSNDGNRYFLKCYYQSATIIRCEIRDQNGFVTDSIGKFTVSISQ